MTMLLTKFEQETEDEEEKDAEYTAESDKRKKMLQLYYNECATNTD